MEKVYEMSPANKITVFPEGRAAVTVLAVDLDDETREYLTTYPGTARWLSEHEASDLADGLATLGKHSKDEPAAVPGLLENLRSETSITGGLLILLVPSLLAVAFVLYGPEFLPLPVRLIVGIAAGVSVPFITRALIRKKNSLHVDQDEQLKRTYDKRLDEAAADHLVSLDDPAADDVREALAHADEIHNNLKLIRRYGLSTLEEPGAADEHLATVLRSHIAIRAAQPRLERFEAVLRDLDCKTIAADVDLQNIQRLREELSRTAEATEKRGNAALSELNQLNKATTTTLRRTEAKLQAAELTRQEETEL